MRYLNRKGFTLVEIMIVVAIVALLAAIAIPNVIRARLNANEGAAMSALRTIYTAAESYRAVQTPPRFPASVTMLAEATPPYIPSTFFEGSATQGYVYHVARSAASPTVFTAQCYPETIGTTGNRSFGVIEDGVLRATAGAIVAEATNATVGGWTEVGSF